MNGAVEKIRKFLKGGNGIKLIVFAGIAGIAILVFSGGDKQTEQNTVIQNIAETEQDYVMQTEIKLTEILQSIEGVGKTKVMITVSESEEKIYAEEKQSDIDENTRREENRYAIIENNGNEEAIIRKTVNPQINGVIIVCEGGNNSAVKEKIYNAVSAGFGIPSNKICVVKLD